MSKTAGCRFLRNRFAKNELSGLLPIVLLYDNQTKAFLMFVTRGLYTRRRVCDTETRHTPVYCDYSPNEKRNVWFQDKLWFHANINWTTAASEQFQCLQDHLLRHRDMFSVVCTMDCWRELFGRKLGKNLQLLATASDWVLGVFLASNAWLERMSRM